MLAHQKVVELLLWFHFLLHIVISTLRDMLQPMILLILLCILTGTHQNLPHNHASLGLLKFSSTTHSRGTLFATRSSTLTTQQPRSATTLWLLACSFCGNRTWRDTIDTGQEPTKLQGILSVLDRFWRRGQDDMMTTKIVAARSFFRHYAHKQGHMKCKLTGWPWAKQLSEQNAIHRTTSGLWQSLTSKQDNTRQMAEMTARLKQTLFSSSSRSWEWWLPGTWWSPLGSFTRWIWAAPIWWCFPIRTLTRFVRTPVLARWRCPSHRSVPWPRWCLPIGRTPSIIVFLDRLLLGFLELGLPFFGCSRTIVLEPFFTNGHEGKKVPW